MTMAIRLKSLAISSATSKGTNGEAGNSSGLRNKSGSLAILAAILRASFAGEQFGR